MEDEKNITFMQKNFAKFSSVFSNCIKYLFKTSKISEEYKMLFEMDE